MVDGKIVCADLLPKAPWLKLKQFSALVETDPAHGPVLPVIKLLVALVKLNQDRFKVVFASLVSWLSLVLEARFERLEPSDDPLELPTFQGPVRSRRVDQATKAAVVSIAMSKGLASSGAQAMAVLQNFKRFMWGRSAATANSWGISAARNYLLKGMAWCKDSSWSTVCLAWDATRVSGRESLWFAWCSPDLPKAFWGPPAVGSSVAPLAGQGFLICRPRLWVRPNK